MNCFVSSESLWISLFWGLFYPCLVSMCWCLYGLVPLGALGGGVGCVSGDPWKREAPKPGDSGAFGATGEVAVSPGLRSG